jgi:hypothetical protein
MDDMEKMLLKFEKEEEENSDEDVYEKKKTVAVTSIDLMKLVKKAERDLKERSTKLTEEMGVRPIDKFFVCSICYNIAGQPLTQCSSCQIINCQPCIDEWLKHSPKCPMCKQNYESEKVARFAMNTIQELEFNCDKCEEVFKYKDKEDH